MNDTELEHFARRYTDAWCSCVAANVAGFFAKNGSISVNGELSSGRAAIAAMAQGFMSAFPDLVLIMDDVEIQGEKSTYHWTFTGTNTGPDGTGRRVNFSGFEEWTFADDGLIAKSIGHFDEDEYQYQLEHGAA